jgi:hypothetical protein
MPRLLTFLLLAVAVVLLDAGGVAAKGPVDRITILAPGATQSVDMTDEDGLAAFDPWGRRFIDWDKGTASEPGTETSIVSFSVDGRTIYVLEFARDPTGNGGYIYIPGGRHWAGALNSGTIITGSSDRWDPNGKWHHATAAWVALMAGANGITPPATGGGGLR